MILELIEQQKLLPILRHTDQQVLLDIGRALQAGGCQVLEITLMSEHAYAAIAQLRSEGLRLGAGTVLNREQAMKAHDAGAEFLVSPGICEDLLGNPPLPYLPGVATPSEVMRAYEAGFHTLKLFPANTLGGIAYLKALSGPFPNLRWLVTGGIEPQELHDYLQAGAMAVGLGGHLFPAHEVGAGNWKAISDRYARMTG